MYSIFLFYQGVGGWGCVWGIHETLFYTDNNLETIYKHPADMVKLTSSTVRGIQIIK